MNRFPISRQSLASILAAAVLALGISGCTTVGVAAVSAPSEPATSGLDVRVFDRARDATAGHLSPGRVLSVLETAQGAAVHNAEGADWSLSGLAPGEYRLRIRQWKKGNLDPARPDAQATKKLALRPGERTAVDVIARKVTTGAVLGTVAAVVVVAAVIAAVSVQNSMSKIDLKFERRPTEPTPLGVAAGPVPGAVAPPPEELEKIARTVARAFPE
jgi:hypothetical protein